MNTPKRNGVGLGQTIPGSLKKYKKHYQRKWCVQDKKVITNLVLITFHNTILSTNCMKILDNSSFSDILVSKYITVKFAPTFVAAHHTDIFNRPFPSSPLPLSKQNESTCETIHMEVFLSTGLFSCKSNFAKTCFVHTGTRQLGNGLPRYILSIVTSLIPLSFL